MSDPHQADPEDYPLGPSDPFRYVIAIWHPGVPLSLTDESVWTRSECERDVPQVEEEMAGSRAIICELRPVDPASW
jgi:hypothetical protein